MKKAALLLLTISLSVSCTTKTETNTTEHYKSKITKAEKEFQKMVSEKGIAEGFYYFADENATIKRENDTLIIGKENIRNYYSNPKYKNATVKWSPDFISVSESGDLAYTYGKHNWSAKDSLGKTIKAKGVFHTV